MQTLAVNLVIYLVLVPAMVFGTVFLIAHQNILYTLVYAWWAYVGVIAVLGSVRWLITKPS